jgi:signal transduction histidine kinase
MVFFLAWTVQGLLHALAPTSLAPRDTPSSLLLASSDLVQAVLLAVFCYAMASAALSRRLSWMQVTLLVMGAAVALPLLRVAYLSAVHAAFGTPITGRALLQGVPAELMATAGFLGLGFTVAYAAGAQARELAMSRLERELAEARLQALQAQLHPHFLFNAFNSIAALMHRDVDAADRMLARLGELLRRVLRRSSDPFVTLGEELEFVELYLEIEQARFGERLRVGFDVDPSARSAMVPHLLLQPLVENAVRHGIAPSTTGGRVDILAAPDGGELRVEVRDSGMGLPPGWAPSRVGVGLSSVRTRLEHVYGARHTLSIESPPGGGVRVRISLPFVESATRLPASSSTKADGGEARADGRFPVPASREEPA